MKSLVKLDARPRLPSDGRYPSMDTTSLRSLRNLPETSVVHTTRKNSTAAATDAVGLSAFSLNPENVAGHVRSLGSFLLPVCTFSSLSAPRLHSGNLLATFRCPVSSHARGLKPVLSRGSCLLPFGYRPSPLCPPSPCHLGGGRGWWMGLGGRGGVCERWGGDWSACRCVG